jgi:hypothetical protein
MVGRNGFPRRISPGYDLLILLHGWQTACCAATHAVRTCDGKGHGGQSVDHYHFSNPLVVTSTAQVKVFSSVEACEHNCALLQDGMKQCTQWTAAVASGIVS